MIYRKLYALLLAAFLLGTLLAACAQLGTQTGSELYVPELIAKAKDFNGKQVTVNGYYVRRPGEPTVSVLAPVVSTLDNGLDAQPAGDAIWVDGFPDAALAGLHQPGDAIYGLVRMIEVCTGITPEVTENVALPYTFDVKIALPKDGDIDKNLIDELIQAHKPAHAGYRLEVL